MPRADPAREADARNKIHEYGKHLFGSSYDVDSSDRKIASWVTKRNMTYQGILFTIDYWFRVLGSSIEDANNGFGIVPYVYNDAREYHMKTRGLHMESYTADVIDKVVNSQTSTVSVSAPDPVKKTYLKGFELK